ncbi:helix-turn-helix transcriptional regulator [Mesorhizobium sp. BAC0120]|uniref:helix-turn-helix domain-containing protein n=1 Tax=Mesorhizobium sp. BAC0120 TaxID=3090670 RepID=UPI00298CEF1B|nr:helix-turn-helix transcriptional regulator [Mesorhizobium sp. BAC0120]MDW6021150.1 helix-turn-helix transcriptional regulator [Mesorhizobium sp. BAC0120]
MNQSRSEIGVLIREWRTRRRMSQLDLASEAEVSQRHLSFIESGRAQPSRDMVLKLSERLDIPLRQRNRLLVAAGFAPNFGERPLDHPSLAPALAAVESVLRGHEPNPALAVDRHWNMVAGNGMVAPLLEGIAEASLLAPPVNVMRLSLHPKGLAPRIVNLPEWRAHLLARLRRLIETTGDPALEELEAEMLTYPSGVTRLRTIHDEGTAIVHPLRIKAKDLVLSFISTISVFGTPLDVTLSELAIESFFPADEQTRFALQKMAAGQA